jgi:membrane fusion protein, multidrug efflux system
LYVYLVGDGNKVSVQPVMVGLSGDGNSVITQGLTPGQSVVVAGQYRLQPGSVVQPGEAKGAQEANKAADIPLKVP